MKYDLVVCGGTFDLLHSGHKKFIKAILDVSSNVLIGLTSDKYISQNKSLVATPFDIRKKELEDFVTSIEANERVKTVPIDDVYGPLLDPSLNVNALAVTPETKSGAEEINRKRAEQGLSEVEVIIIPMEKAEDGALISSTRIRRGEINREGKLYIQNKWLNQNLILPQNLRPQLQKPFGEVLGSVPSGLIPSEVITIGDITTQKFNEKKIGQFLSIVDFQVQRKKAFDDLAGLGFEEEAESIKIENPAGEITSSLFVSIQKAFENSNRKIIQVSGEEDLAVLPALLASPLGFTVFYGQPNVGLTEVRVTEEIKEKAFDLLSKFTN